MKLKFIPIAFIGAALVACGGGGGGGSGGGTGTTGSTGNTTLSVTAKVNGVVVAGYPATAASAPAITLSSGQELEVTSSIPTVFGGNLNGAVAAVRANTTTTYKAVLAASTDTTATLTFSSTSLPLQTSTIPVAVKAAQFQAVVPKVGDSFVYTESDVFLNGGTSKFDTTQRVAAVNPDGTWIENYLLANNTPFGTANYTKEGNRTSFVTDPAASSSLNCDIGGSKVRVFNPQEKLLAFPLTVGSTFTGSWQTTCVNGTTVTASQNESITARVVGYESVTTAANVFNALRIDETTTVTNSTNGSFPNGGYTQAVSVWFDPVLGRNVKFSGTRTYLGTPTAAQSSALVGTSVIELSSYVKN